MPIFEIQHPNGQTYEVDAPDIETASKPFESSPSTYGTPAQPEAPLTLEGLNAAAGSGVANTAAGFAGLPRTIGTLGAQGIQKAANYIGSKFGLEPDTRDLTQDGLIRLPTAEEARATIATPYEPQNKYERAAETVGENLPSALFPGGPALRAASVALPAGAEIATREAGGGKAAQFLASVVGGMAASKAANMIERAVATKLPIASEMEKITNRQYNEIEQLGAAQTLPKGTADNLVDSIKNSLHVQNRRASNSPKTYETLDELAAGTPGQPHDVNDLINARRKLGGVGGKDGVAAGMARQMIDQAIETRTPGMIAKLEIADRNYNGWKVADELTDKFKKAELQDKSSHSGLNFGNKLRQSATQLATNPNRTRYMTDAERGRLEQLAQGSGLQNPMRYWGNVLGGGGGLGALLAGAIGGHYIANNPEGGAGAAAIPMLAGYALRKGFNRSTANQARGLAAQAMQRTPEAISRGARYVPPTGILGTVPRGLLSGGIFGINQ